MSPLAPPSVDPIRRLGALCALALFAAAPSAAHPLTVAIDCPGYVPGCDRSFFQTEISFAQFVRDQADADVYVLVVNQGTGGGGERYTLFFEGRRDEVAGRRDTLSTSTPPGASTDDQRRALLSRLSLGLAGFVAQTDQADQVSIRYDVGDTKAAAVASPPTDPWNSWVFRLSGRGFFRGQSRSRSMNVFGALQASRITEALKLSVRPRINYDRRQFELSDSSTVVSDNVSLGLNGRAVRSLSSHWSAGVQASASRSTFSNYDLQVRAAPAIEYNVYPYSESTNRQLRISYEAGVEFAAYADTTIFLKTAETLPFHRIGGAAEFRQPWGSIDIYSGVSQYLSEPDKYNASIGGGVDLRLFRGFSLNVNGNYSLVRDQINLPVEDASDDAVLTSQQELATGFDYRASIGVSYSFGSIYNQVVNARFGNG